MKLYKELAVLRCFTHKDMVQLIKHPFCVDLKMVYRSNLSVG